MAASDILDSRLWSAARWVLVVMALMALNLAAAAYRPGFNIYKRRVALSSQSQASRFGPGREAIPTGYFRVRIGRQVFLCSMAKHERNR